MSSPRLIARALSVGLAGAFALGVGALALQPRPPRSASPSAPAVPAPAPKPAPQAAVSSPRAAEISDEEAARLRARLSAPAPQRDFMREAWVADVVPLIAARVGDEEEARAIAEAAYDGARAFDLDPWLVLAVIAVESGFDRFALSRAGARGLMQVMPFWKARIGRKEDNLMDITTNIRYGCAILRHYLDRHGSLTKALAAYNGSRGSVRYPWRVFAVMRKLKHGVAL